MVQGDRLDNITAKYLGDPEQFWRMCDANGAMRPEELTETIGSTHAHHIAARNTGIEECLKALRSNSISVRWCRYRRPRWLWTR